MRNLTITIWLVLCSGSAWAVTSQDIQARYSLVGVIAAEREDEASIVVLKDVVSRRSITVKVGQPLPQDKRWSVGEVYRNGVVITNGNEQVRVGYNSASASPQGEPSSYVDTEPAFIVTVTETGKETTPTDYNNTDTVEYLDNLVSNRENLEERMGTDDPMEALDEYEQHLRRELRRVREEKTEQAEPDDSPAIESDDYSQDPEPVFEDVPDGPTYFQ